VLWISDRLKISWVGWTSTKLKELRSIRAISDRRLW